MIRELKQMSFKRRTIISLSKKHRLFVLPVYITLASAATTMTHYYY